MISSRRKKKIVSINEFIPRLSLIELARSAQQLPAYVHVQNTPHTHASVSEIRTKWLYWRTYSQQVTFPLHMNVCAYLRYTRCTCSTTGQGQISDICTRTCIHVPDSLANEQVVGNDREYTIYEK